MRAPTVKTLLANFRDLTPENARLIRALAHATDDSDQLQQLIERKCPATHAYARSCYNNPFNSKIWRVTMAMHAIDIALGTYGIEGLGPQRSGDYAPPYEYCNAGDPYVATLIYDRDKDRLTVSCWGDLAESDPRLRESEN